MAKIARIGFAVVAPVILLALIACGQHPPCTPFLDAADQGDVEVVREHIELGKNPDQSFVWSGSEHAGASALHLAVLEGHEEIVGLLLDNGADINIKAKDEYRGTPLHWAAFVGNKQMAEMLVNAGADINATDKDGHTPLDAVLSNPDLDSGSRTETEEYLRSIGGKTRD